MHVENDQLHMCQPDRKEARVRHADSLCTATRLLVSIKNTPTQNSKCIAYVIPWSDKYSELFHLISNKRSARVIYVY